MLVQFWLLADNFQEYWAESSGKQRLDDALAMYNRFISLEAPEPLGVRKGRRGSWRTCLLIETSIAVGRRHAKRD